MRGVAVGDVGLYSSDHVHGGLVESHEDTVVELSESQKLEDLFAGRVQLVDTKFTKVLSFIIYIFNNKRWPQAFDINANVRA